MRGTWSPLALLVLVALQPAALATPEAQLQALEFELDVTIREHVALTRLNLTLANPTANATEALLQLPLSDTAVLTQFRLHTHNATYTGVVSERGEARATYNASRDAGRAAVHLESSGRGRLALRATVPAREQARLEATYVESVALRHGIQTYRFPLQALPAAYGPLGRLVVALDASATHPWLNTSITGIGSAATLDPDGHLRLRHEQAHAAPDEPFEIGLTPRREGYVSSIVLARRAADAALIFHLLPPGSAAPLPLDVVFVLDRSGSMEGDKILQAQAALATILAQLRTDDRFGLVAFDSDVTRSRDHLVPTTGPEVAAAQGWLRGVQANGSTDIEAALRSALELLGPHERAAVPAIVLVTDGQPTAGVTDPRAILASVRDHNAARARLHVVGIGFDQDNAFLGELASQNRGEYQAVGPQENASRALTDFYDRIGSPVLRDVNVTFEGLAEHDAVPRPLPDVYAGRHLTLAVRAPTLDLPPTITAIVTGWREEGFTTERIPLSTTALPLLPQVESLWARLKAATLERAIAVGDPAHADALRAELLALGLLRQVETTQTSWVAVELGANETVEPRQTDDGRIVLFRHPVDLTPDAYIPERPWTVGMTTASVAPSDAAFMHRDWGGQQATTQGAKKTSGPNAFLVLAIGLWGLRRAAKTKM